MHTSEVTRDFYLPTYRGLRDNVLESGDLCVYMWYSYTVTLDCVLTPQRFPMPSIFLPY